jgi:hypothetical protein
VAGEQAEDDPHVPVHERAAGRPRAGVVVDAGPLDVPPVPLGRGVVDGERHLTVEVAAEFPTGASDQIRRAVSENTTSLGFKTKDWE